MSGADVSHDGKRLTFFRLNGKQMELVVSERDASNPRVIMQAAVSFSFRQPRWSPDDSTIAYLHSLQNWADDVYIVSSRGGEVRQVTTDNTLMSGLAWLTDGSRLVYSSARGNTVIYLPTLHLWTIRGWQGSAATDLWGIRGRGSGCRPGGPHSGEPPAHAIRYLEVSGRWHSRGECAKRSANHPSDGTSADADLESR